MSKQDDKDRMTLKNISLVEEHLMKPLKKGKIRIKATLGDIFLTTISVAIHRKKSLITTF